MFYYLIMTFARVRSNAVLVMKVAPLTQGHIRATRCLQSSFRAVTPQGHVARRSTSQSDRPRLLIKLVVMLARLWPSSLEVGA